MILYSISMYSGARSSKNKFEDEENERNKPFLRNSNVKVPFVKVFSRIDRTCLVTYHT